MKADGTGLTICNERERERGGGGRNLCHQSPDLEEWYKRERGGGGWKGGRERVSLTLLSHLALSEEQSETGIVGERERVGRDERGWGEEDNRRRVRYRDPLPEPSPTVPPLPPPPFSPSPL